MKYTMVLFLVAFSLIADESFPQKNVMEKWESPTPWIKDRFTDFLDQMPHHAIAVEVGVQGGGYAASMLARTNPQKLYLIDCWQHQSPDIYMDPESNVSDEEQMKLYRETQRRFANDSRVVIMRKYSIDAAPLFEDESLDWVYIDANHSYSAAKQDIALWWPKIKKGGILSGHDYAIREGFGVVQAVNEFLVEQNIYFYCLSTEPDHIYHSWSVRKP